MGIYIKNMKMPIDGDSVIIVINNENGITKAEVDEYCGAIYEAIPIPLHGDLIDRDKFRNTLFIGEQCLYSWDELEDAIDFAPVIIPAEEDERRLQKPKEWET